MILQKKFLPEGRLKGIAKDSTILEALNEIKRENIIQINSLFNMSIVLGYDVFYEDENIYACPGCGHHISNTFSYCPNCAHKMSDSVDQPLKCPTCDSMVAYTFKHCPECGGKLK